MRRIVAFPLVLLALLQACGDGGSEPLVPTTIQVTPTTLTFTAVGDAQTVTATVLDQNGNAIAGAVITWQSNNQSVASVDASGLVTSRGAGATQIQARVEGVFGAATVTVDQIAEVIGVATGDAQIGEVGEPLPLNPTVEVRDANGSPVVDKPVAWSVVDGGGSVSRSIVNTGPTGRASTSWTLGPTAGAAQLLRATIGDLTQDFVATAEKGLLAITTVALDNGRATLTYDALLEAKGGSLTGYTFSLQSGTLPDGLSLSTDGSVSGTPTTKGSSLFTVRLQDSEGAEATRDLGIEVCDAPLGLSTGQLLTYDASEVADCGFFLRSAPGAAYRVTLTRPLETESAVTVATTLQMQGDGTVASPPARVAALQQANDVGASAIPLRDFRSAIGVAQATEAFHLQVRDAERRLIGGLDRSGLIADRSALAAPGLFSAAKAAPDTARFDVPEDASSCTSGQPNTAVLLAESEHMAIYQSTTQNSGASAVSVALAQKMLDFYESYGFEVIRDYFGGTTDINEDGQVTVLITPDIGDQVAAFVWSGDFFTAAQCRDSNEREIIYFSADVINSMGGENPSYQALATVVHEVKHVSSLYNRVARGGSDPFHPPVIEEGTAEIAGEVASRIAWADKGGPAVGTPVDRQDFVDGGVTEENYGIFLRMARVVWFLSSQPNGLTASVSGAQNGIYGSGWQFHRFLGDVYGNAASPLADAALFKSQNDSVTATGFDAYPSLVGKSFTELELEFAVAVTVAGTAPDFGVPEWTTYDYATATEVFSNPDPAGSFPWPVTRTCNGLTCSNDLESSPDDDNDDGVVAAAQFGTRTYFGNVGPGGIRVHEFESNGTGVGADFSVAGPAGLKVIIAKIR